MLVNNAAVTFLAPVEEFSEKRFRLMVELQMWAPYHLTQLVLPGMYERGAGWLLNISSRAAQLPQGPLSMRLELGGSRSMGCARPPSNGSPSPVLPKEIRTA